MGGKKGIVEQALRLITGSGDDVAAGAAKIVKSNPSPAEYIEPGSMRYLYQHPETGSYMEIVTRPKGARSASVIGLEVPEEYRGQGIGKALQGAVLNDFPSLMGQVSSKAAAVNAYKAGRRPIGNPNATIEDVFKMIDEDSSVNLATEKNSGGRTNYGPGGVIDDIVKMAGRIVSGADEPAKTGIRAYHGSPHDFDRFDMSKIGTGEGAQAYGHGLYFAEHEPVARGYRDRLTIDQSNSPIAAGKGYEGDPDVQRILAEVKRLGLPVNSLDALIKETGERAQRLAGEGFQFDAKTLGDLQYDLIEHADKFAPAGSMYEVNINADPNTFLDWDKPLSEQPEAVRRLAGWTPEAEAEYRKASTSDTDALLAALEGESQYVPAKMPQPPGAILPFSATGDELHQKLFHQARRELEGRGASGAYSARVAKKLREAGIPGIKYLDAGSRGKGVAYVQPMYKGKPYSDPIPAHAWNQVDQLVNDYKAKGFDVEVQDLGTRNYVVFDDKLISIIRKYGIAGASAMLGYNLMEQLDPKQALAASMADQDYQSSRPQRSMGGNNSVSGALNVARGLHGGM